MDTGSVSKLAIAHRVHWLTDQLNEEVRHLLEENNQLNVDLLQWQQPQDKAFSARITDGNSLHHMHLPPGCAEDPGDLAPKWIGAAEPHAAGLVSNLENDSHVSDASSKKSSIKSSSSSKKRSQNSDPNSGRQKCLLSKVKDIYTYAEESFTGLTSVLPIKTQPELRTSKTERSDELVVGHEIPSVRRPIFPDAEAMKEEIRLLAKGSLTKRKVDLYKRKGVAQQIVRSPTFETMALGAILLNSIWLWIDADYNGEAVLTQADVIFQVMENAFCTFFTLEWILRFAALERKVMWWQDGWFFFRHCNCDGDDFGDVGCLHPR